MKIIRLTVSNILRIQAATVTPDPTKGLVIVAGKNSAGKSSLLNSIALALSGKDFPEQPIHRGKAKAEVTLETEEFTLTRSFSQTGGAKLVVRAKGATANMAAGQTYLDTLYSRVSYDPLAFTRLEAKDQISTLKRIVGLDFSDLDKAHETIFQERKLANRDLEDAQAVMARRQFHEDAPAALIVSAELAEKLSQANKRNEANTELRSNLVDMHGEVEDAIIRCNKTGAEIERLQTALNEARAKLERENELREDSTVRRESLKAQVEALEDIDTDPIFEEMRQADELNAKFRDNKLHAEGKADLEKHAAAVRDLNARLLKIKEDRDKRLEKVKYPVEGLGFSDSGVTFNNLPFKQAGAAEQIRVSLAIGKALNPQMPVMLIRDGSLLDADSLQIVEEFAEDTGAQVWLEVVGNSADATVTIEDGNSV